MTGKKLRLNTLLLNKKVTISIGIVLVLVLVSLIATSFAELLPIRTVEFYSDSLDYFNSDQGAFKVSESAYWKSKNKLELKIDVDSIVNAVNKKTDVILVFGSSSTMDADKMAAIRDAKDKLENYLFGMDDGNKLAIVTYNSTASVLSDFSRDSTDISSVQLQGNSSYTLALIEVGNLLSTYVQEEGRDCVVVFIADGYCSKDSGQVDIEYQLLKAQYSFVKFRGISFETGNNVVSDLNRVSDAQTIANKDNISRRILSVVSDSTQYSQFKIENYINTDYFEIENASKIVSNIGTTSLVNDNQDQKIVWNLESNYYSGENISLTAELKLKDAYVDESDIYEIIKDGSIIATIGDSNEDIEVDKTPIVGNNYVVVYDGNAPSDCSVHDVPESTHFGVYDVVNIEGTPSCEGYKFGGWEVSNDNVKMMGSNSFIMPEENVNVKAKWAKVSVVKSLEGNVYPVATLYDIVKNSSVGDDRSQKFSSSVTAANNNAYKMASTSGDDYPIYYYRGKVDNNNVVFSNLCWKIVRTTSDGGIKLVYNGAFSNGQCSSSSSGLTSIKFNSPINSISDVSYTYGKRYPHSSVEYDEKWYSLYGLSISDKVTDAVTNTESYYPIGTLSNLATSLLGSGDHFYYSSSVTYNGSVYKLSSAKKLEYPVTTLESDRMKNTYTCKATSSSGTCSTVYYILETPTIGLCVSNCYKKTAAKYITLSNGETYDSVKEKSRANGKWIFGSSVTYSDGVYTLNDTISISPGDVKSNSSSIIDTYNYTCFSTENTCSNVKNIIGFTMPNFDRDYLSYVTLHDGDTKESIVNYLNTIYYDVYGKGYTYSNGVYTLTDATNFPKLNWKAENSKVSSEGYRYTCFSKGDSCSTLYYVYRTSSGIAYAYELTNGVGIDGFYDGLDSDEYDSKIKAAVDTWYENNILGVGDDYLEDDVWCNDKGIDTNNSSLLNSATINFPTKTRLTNYAPTLSCNDLKSRYTVSSENGNGYLKYPIGLLTADEIVFAGAKFGTSNSYFYLSTSYSWFTMSPYDFSGTASIYYFDSGTTLKNSVSDTSAYFRPAISLKSSARIVGGVGTLSNPYIVGDIFKISLPNNITSNYHNAIPGQTITLSSSSGNVVSFKLNGKNVNGASFTMPYTNANVTNVVCN